MARTLCSASRIAAIAVLAGCALVEPLEPLEPRRRDPFPVQAAKAVVWAPSAVLLVAAEVAVLGAILCCTTAAQHVAEDAARDDALRGGPSPASDRVPVFEPR